ncbi:MAG: putative Tic20 family protein, partial [Glaciecola sp.]
MTTNHQKNIATFIHLSTFSRFIIPLGNFIGPIVLWIMNKDKSDFIDTHGKQAINFQMSILLYAIIIGTLTIPFFIFK